MKTFLSIVVLLVLSPALAELALICIQPDFSGGAVVGPLEFFGFFLFSLPFIFVTVPLWPTYFPAIIFTPLIMRRIAMRPAFKTMKLPALLGIALLAGSIVGVCVFAWFIMIAARESWFHALSWVAAGAISGSISLALIFLIYRYEPRCVGQP